MARAAASAPPPLWLLWLCWALPGAATVQAPAQVQGFLGDTVTLPCYLPPEADMRVTQVTWLRQEPAGGARNIAVFHSTRGASVSEPERLEFVAARPGAELWNASLAVSGLRAEDEANYTCQFATFPQGSRSARTWLRVLAQPQNTVEPQEVLLGQQPREPEEPVAVARCVSAGGRPPGRITWFSHLNGTASESQGPGPQSGTATIISLFALVPSSQADGQNITCRVEHESQREPALLPVTLAVRYPPEVSISGYDDNWYLGRSEAALTCDVRSNPEPTSYDWSTIMGPLPPSAVAQGPQLLIAKVDESVNTTFICLVTNSLGTGRGELPILVREARPGEQPGSGMSVWIVVLLVLVITGVLGSVLFGILLCLRRRQRSRSRTDRSSASANGAVSYKSVTTEDSAPQTDTRR
ncbi:poliovirus receptor [Lepus europaeus]|uniref:poliovirus receptor n=1 Tax=Lepus europaeus TaxID=9983 RepID=UPI002B4971BD|nr:poliovirus receptor [Lepus europaeus]